MTTWTIEHDGDVALLSRDDGKANTVLVPEFQGLEAALETIAASKASAVVISGRPGFFSAGLNLKALGAMSMQQKQELVSAMGSAVLKLFLFPRPVVAAVSGHALGGGAMFALAADVRLFAEGAFKFGLNEVPAGLFVPTYAIELMRAAVSPAHLTPLVVHGRVINPTEALAMNVAESVHAPDALKAAALARARALGELNGTGYAATKRLVREGGAQLAKGRLAAELEQLASLMG
jgi:enoyl-CoA hydratase